MKRDPVPTVDLLTGRRKTRITIRLGVEIPCGLLASLHGGGGVDKSLSKLKYVSSTWLTVVRVAVQVHVSGQDSACSGFCGQKTPWRLCHVSGIIAQ